MLLSKTRCEKTTDYSQKNKEKREEIIINIVIKLVNIKDSIQKSY